MYSYGPPHKAGQKQDDKLERTFCSYVCYILTFDPAQKYYSKVIHRKEVTHSNGQ